MIIENGIVAGNRYDKYGTKNPVARYLMNGFLKALNHLISVSGVQKIHEVGCGEGNLSIALAAKNKIVQASDVSGQVVEEAKKRAQSMESKLDLTFKVASIYELARENDSAPLVMCCEVLEHLSNPEEALRILATLADPYLLVSVPREPMWSLMNLARLKYISRFGNTEGHLQQWSKAGFLKLLSRHFQIVEVMLPIPWTMALCRTRECDVDRRGS